ncbi:unnamed protein product [Durusdinium trenchii]|uniref:Uncharacterized protein n=1 Tax=Durusdinium trenchii TaxID=1381693 RepID=A0ABP0IRG6_9DINO
MSCWHFSCVNIWKIFGPEDLLRVPELGRLIRTCNREGRSKTRSAVKSSGTFRHGHRLSRNFPPRPSPQPEQAEALEAEREAIVTLQKRMKWTCAERNGRPLIWRCRRRQR